MFKYVVEIWAYETDSADEWIDHYDKQPIDWTELDEWLETIAAKQRSGLFQVRNIVVSELE